MNCVVNITLFKWNENRKYWGILQFIKINGSVLDSLLGFLGDLEELKKKSLYTMCIDKFMLVYYVT